MWPIRLRADRNQDLRRYNLPTANDEVAAIILGDGSEEQSNHRDILLRLHGGQLRRIQPHASVLCFSALCCSLSSWWRWAGTTIYLHTIVQLEGGGLLMLVKCATMLIACTQSRRAATFVLGWKSFAAVCCQCLGIYRAKQIKLGSGTIKRSSEQMCIQVWGMLQ